MWFCTTKLACRYLDVLNNLTVNILPSTTNDNVKMGIVIIPTGFISHKTIWRWHKINFHPRYFIFVFHFLRYIWISWNYWTINLTLLRITYKDKWLISKDEKLHTEKHAYNEVTVKLKLLQFTISVFDITVFYCIIFFQRVSNFPFVRDDIRLAENKSAKI